jgi:hypothetical protein
MKEFCENQYCDNPGAKVVPVSVERQFDGKRTLCVPCEEAYSWGVQHGTKVARAKAAKPSTSAAKGLVISPPPKESKGQLLFRVIYVIDINAVSPVHAARQTYQILVDPDSELPVVDVMDHRGKVKRIDLSYQRRARQNGQRP